MGKANISMGIVHASCLPYQRGIHVRDFSWPQSCFQDEAVMTRLNFAWKQKFLSQTGRSLTSAAEAFSRFVAHFLLRKPFKIDYT